MPGRGSGQRPFWYLRRSGEAVGSEIDEELTHHLDLRIAELQARGYTPVEARHEAVRRFGDLDYTQRYCRQQNTAKEREMRRRLITGEFLRDLKVSARALLHAPLLAATIVLTVGLGIGATTAIFTAINTALLRPLPYADADRLVWIYTDSPPFRFRFSAADYLALQAQQTQFERIAGYTERTAAYSDGVTAERLRGREVSWTYFDLFGIRPAMGRDFTEVGLAPGHTSLGHRESRFLAASSGRHGAMHQDRKSNSTARHTRSPACCRRCQVPSSARRSFTPRRNGTRRSERVRSSSSPSDERNRARSRRLSKNCTRSTSACSRSGVRRIRTKRQRGRSWTCARSSSATCGRWPDWPSRPSASCG